MMMCYEVMCCDVEVSGCLKKLLLQHDSSRAALNAVWLGDRTMYTASFISSKRS